jgi:hypothetical protein
MTRRAGLSWVAHLAPAWRDRADLAVLAELPATGLPALWEELPVRHLRTNLFEVCAIPFFVRNVALGDVVVATACGADRHLLDCVAHRGGRRVFRVWFDRCPHLREEIQWELTGLGAVTEWFARSVLAVDAEDAAHAELIAHHLAQRERLGQLHHEDACA